MTKPVPTGIRAQRVAERIKQEAHEGKTELIDSLFLILGDDQKSGIAGIKSVLERLERIEQSADYASKQKFNAALLLLDEGSETT